MPSGGPQDPVFPDPIGVPGPSVPQITSNNMAGSHVMNSPGAAISCRDSSRTAGGSATQIHQIRSGAHQGGTATGPIRNRHRKDTSPYGSDRLSISNATVGSSSHLSPPDTSGAWRRVRSDPFLHSSVKSNGSSGVSPSGSICDTPTVIQGSNGAISPLQGASPTMQRRSVPYDSTGSHHLHHACKNVQNVESK